MSFTNKVEAMDSLRDVWRWWLEELALLIPRHILEYFSASTALLRIREVPGGCRFELIAGDKVQSIGDIDLLAAKSDELNVFRQRLIEILETRPQVEFIPPRESFLSREIYLPLAAESHISSVILYEIDKFTPFKKDSALFGYRITQRHPEQEKFSVEICAIHRDELLPYLSKLQSLNIVPSAVYSPDYIDTTNAIESLNVLPPSERKQEEPLWNRDAKRYAMLAAISIILVLALPAWYLEMSITRVDSAIEKSRVEASRVAEKRGLVSSHVLAGQAIATRKNGHPKKLELLLEVTRAMPDNTWVSRMRVDNDKVTLQGESGKASDLIELLEQSDILKNVRFKSSITYNRRTQDEMYEIEAELAGVKL